MAHSRFHKRTFRDRFMSLIGRKPDETAILEHLDTDALLALMRHETHRIEKAVYNDILACKQDIFTGKHNRLQRIYSILEQRGIPADEPTLQWSQAVSGAFCDLMETFIKPQSGPPVAFTPEAADDFLMFLRSRRSVRVWADNQPDTAELDRIAALLIDTARWAPNSGNRQTLRFRIITNSDEKQLLERIKEKHCTSAPLLIFVGADSRLYGALGEEERCLYLDAGAAIMQMILTAHRCGLGTCWNHFADDLISSRKANTEIYSRFIEKLGIPAYIEPVAIVAVGVPAFIPPIPARMDRSAYLTGSTSSSGD